jgi:hypothetical protein
LPRRLNEQTQTHQSIPQSPGHKPRKPRNQILTSVTVTHQRSVQPRPFRPQTNQAQVNTNPDQPAQCPIPPIQHPSKAPNQQTQDAANVSLPSLCDCQRTKAKAPNARSARAHWPFCLTANPSA